MSAIRLFAEIVCPVLILAECLAPAAVSAQCRPDQRRVTVADTITMTEVSPPEPGSSANPDAVGSFSPDGHHFAVVLERGDLRNDTNIYTLLIYSTRAALETRKPEAVVTMSSNSNRPDIAELRWLENSRTLLFLGEHAGEAAQIYSFDLAARRLRQLTSQPTSVVRYDVSGDGRVIVFEAEPAPRDILDTPGTERGGFVVRGEQLSTILFARYRDRESMAFIGRELFFMTDGGKPRRVATEDAIWPFLTLSVSPDGGHALLGAQVRHIPPEWMLYKDRLLHEEIATRKQPRSISMVETYLLLDTRTATLSPLLSAPKDWPDDGYLWLDGGRSLVVSHAYLPLGGVTAEEKKARERRPFVVEILLPSRDVVRIGRDNLTATGWDAATGEVTLQNRLRDPLIREVYRRQGNAWEKVSPVPREDTRPRLSILQGMNTPPTVWLSDPVSGRRTRLLDLNPQFRRLCFGREKEIAWRATDGHEVQGGLYLPPDYTPGHRYPLVIQTHLFNPHEFWIDGPWHSAFAAQPLAARDIVVLQMGYDHVGEGTPKEAPRAMAAIDGAIDFLGEQGIIDPKHVGIIGFSRTVYHVAYTLTHSSHHFAAATLADGFDGDYFQAIAFPATTASEAASVNGGPPYGPDLAKWLGRSPLFDIAAVDSPIRLESYGMDSVLGLWGWYALLTQRGMPVDMIILPDAPHLLDTPWERMVSQQGNVDWFCFWLKTEIYPAPGKATEYARWESLRRLLRNASTEDQPPRGDQGDASRRSR